MYSTATDMILQYHVLFASLMARRIEEACESQYNMKHDDSETTRLAKSISKASGSLSITVTSMKDGVDLFISALRNVQVGMKNERSQTERILRWLKSLFKVIAIILDTASPPSTVPKRQKSAIFVSTLREAAAKIRPGAFLEHIIPSKDKSN